MSLSITGQRCPIYRANQLMWAARVGRERCRKRRRLSDGDCSRHLRSGRTARLPLRRTGRRVDGGGAARAGTARTTRRPVRTASGRGRPWRASVDESDLVRRRARCHVIYRAALEGGPFDGLVLSLPTRLSRIELPLPAPKILHPVTPYNRTRSTDSLARYGVASNGRVPCATSTRPRGGAMSGDRDELLAARSRALLQDGEPGPHDREQPADVLVAACFARVALQLWNLARCHVPLGRRRRTS
jgi:hypothetical protein